ncbi:hypothetical protein [Sphingomonas sp. BK235]|uniref:hypothetical protein n=1 Tax=Sphingomonas sp. BK235 TaxID=2512131 RepID=UPI00104F8B8F|nr:hypothetical protein [Sphingomonas sp. BK235]
MTQPGATTTLEAALFRIVGQIGVATAAEVAGLRAEQLLASCDPNRGERLKMPAAMRLDLYCEGAESALFPLSTLVLEAELGVLKARLRGIPPTCAVAA